MAATAICEGALEAAEKAIEVAPEDATAQLRKAELLVDMGVREGSKERLAQGRAIVDAVLAKSPDMPEAHFVRAKLDLSEGKADDAVSSLRRALDRRADWAQAHFLLALRAADAERSPAGAGRGAARDRVRLPTSSRRGACSPRSTPCSASTTSRSRKRAACCASVRTIHEMRIALAQSLVFLNKPDEARQELDSIPLDQRGPDVNFAIGRIDMLQGKNEFAREKLLAALEAQPDRTRRSSSRCWAPRWRWARSTSRSRASRRRPTTSPTTPTSSACSASR